MCLRAYQYQLILFMQSSFVMRPMQSSFVKRPLHSQEKQPPRSNIFSNCEDAHLPAIKQLARDEDQEYHLVGPAHLRKQILHQQNSPSRVESLEHFERRSLPELSGTVQAATVLRESVLSKLGPHERRALTRDKRNLQFYRDYQQFWKQSSQRIRDSTGGSRPTLLEGSIQRLLVMPNPEKEELLKNYVNSFWEMSLRNNNYILKRHIKGENRYGEEMEGMLLSEEGTRRVEQSIPKLPLERLRGADHRQFALTGRSKLASETLSCDPSAASLHTASLHTASLHTASLHTARLSKAMTDGAALDRHQQILKMDYDSSHSFFKDEPVS